jgi:uncharacterized membrane protein YbjE (DUF340 family)
MKIFAFILCIAAIGLAFGHATGPMLDPAQSIQQWALFGVLLVVGLPLSQGKKKPADTDKK